MAATFISYRREDSAGYAGRLHEELEQRLGSDQVFRDIDSLRAGQDFVDAIDRRLGQCGALVAVIGRNWLTARTASGALRLEQPDDYVVLEIATALQRPDVLVVPVLVGGAAMPAASELPEKIRALARRHAFTLHDETWEADVDRLAALVSRSAVRRPMSSRRALTFLIATALAVLGAVLVLRNPDNDPEPQRDADPPPSQAAPSDRAAVSPATAATGYAIDIPGMSEVAHDRLIYTLLSGNVTPRGSSKGVRLRFRVVNEGSYDANLWDASFRLAVGDEVLTPTGGLNEVISGRTIRQAIVTFTAPAGASRAVLRILGGSEVAELPLDLSPTGRAPEDEKADAGDSLSRARLAGVLRDSRPLIAGNDLSVTLVSITSRLFVNKLRLKAAVRMANEGRYAIHTGALTLRLAHDDSVSAPVIAPNAAIDGGSTHADDFVFEIPPTSKNIELRASIGNESTRVPLEVR